MSYLIDTQVIVWVASEPERLSPAASAVCLDPAHHLMLSVASIWELVIKSMLGKLDLSAHVPDVVAEFLARGNVTVLPIQAEHAFRVLTLPPYHKDPFDRVLIAQALAEDATIITSDADIHKYPARTAW